MAELYTQLTNELKQAILAHHEQKRDVLRMLLSVVKKEQIDQNCDLDDQDIINILIRERKTRQESIGQYEIGGREDLANQERAEIEIINQYLPLPLDPAQVEEMIKQTIQELEANSIKDMGRVMKELADRLKGRADMKIVGETVKQKLTS
ncbi:MAG TPA: GatB/YqeY domain-containing protein [Candidatus Wirthbacteria bacterium]|nr:GatB/YqeY domain-containing protein [Candidatus Wirthbacteria bacterium]